MSKIDKKLHDVVDVSLLKYLVNPEQSNPYEIKIEQPELTFLGIYNQPDFASLNILMYPQARIIELKSLKLYLQQYRDIIISYERLINQLHKHIIEVYQPTRLKLVLNCNSRGGMSSVLTTDSDWKKEKDKKKHINS